MNIKYLSKIFKGLVPKPEEVEGYTESEITQLEELFDINIEGELRDFFSEAGRCLGGILWEEDMVMYDSRKNLSEHREIQFASREDLIDEGLEEFTGLGEFFFASEEGGKEYFLRTKSANPNLVYIYDENGKVKVTNESFTDYLTEIIKYHQNIIKEVSSGEGEIYNELFNLKQEGFITDRLWAHLTGKNFFAPRGDLLFK